MPNKIVSISLYLCTYRLHLYTESFVSHIVRQRRHLSSASRHKRRGSRRRLAIGWRSRKHNVNGAHRRRRPLSRFNDHHATVLIFVLINRFNVMWRRRNHARATATVQRLNQRNRNVLCRAVLYEEIERFALMAFKDFYLL